MNFSFSEEQRILRDELRRFLSAHSTVDHLRERLAEGDPRDATGWRRLVAEMGLAGLAVPEALGGTGTDAVDVAIVMMELGRVLWSGPFYSSAVLATRAFVAAGDDPAVARLAEGGITATLAAADDGAMWSPESVATITQLSAAGDVTVRGLKRHVFDADIADVLLVAARAGDDVALVEVARKEAGVMLESEPGLDLTRPTCTVALDDAPGRLVTRDGAAAIAAALDEAAAALAAELVGAAERCLEMTVEYLCQRVQFGRPIGSFQALKHRCADLLVELEHARTAAYVAACQAVSGSPEQRAAASAQALVTCGQAGVHVAAAAVQLHGGIGFTWEHDVHLYLRRLSAGAAAFGGTRAQRRRVWELSA